MFLRTHTNPSDLVEITAPSLQTDDVVQILPSRDDPAARISFVIQNIGTKPVNLYKGSYDGTTWTMNATPFVILVPDNLGSVSSAVPVEYHGPIWAGIDDESDIDSGWLLVSESY